MWMVKACVKEKNIYAVAFLCHIASSFFFPVITVLEPLHHPCLLKRISENYTEFKSLTVLETFSPFS